MCERQKLRVGVIFGGRSGEHEVSLVSARSVMAAMDTEKYEIVPIGITKEGGWIASGDPMQALDSGGASLTNPATILPDPSYHGLMKLEDLGELGLAMRLLTPLDVVFPVLHGTYGEDGTVQGLLELAGVPYVGADVTGSAVGMDKAIFKDVMKAHALPIVDHVVVKRKEWEAAPEAVMDRIERALGYPLFTKPANLGSSVGICKCHDREGLADGLAEAARYDRKLVVEVAVPQAREIEISVLGNDDPVASIAGEIVPSREFYSYAAKYLDKGEDASELHIPAPIPPQVAKEMRVLAIQAYKAMDCAGMARVDFLLAGESEELFINEVNTIPGFTSISMYPKLWQASGVPYPELIDRLIQLALERSADRASNETSFEIEE